MTDTINVPRELLEGLRAVTTDKRMRDWIEVILNPPAKKTAQMYQLPIGGTGVPRDKR